MIRLLYDGWPLVRQPNSPEALHLLALLQQLPDEVEALLALPEEPPDWIPSGVAVHVSPSADGLRPRLAWEQRILPRLAETMRADLLHLTTSNPPLFGRRLSVVSPAEAPVYEPSAGSSSSFTDHLRRAVSSGGMSRLRALFWPDDLAAHPPPGVNTPIFHLPSLPQGVESLEAQGAISSSILHDYGLDLPETYILCCCPQGALTIRRLLDAWSWAAGSIGEYYPLLLLGVDAAGQLLNTVAEEYGLGDTVRPLSAVPPGAVPSLVQSCSAAFHPSPISPWDMIARLALLYGKPLVAAASHITSEIVGPAAYLALAEDSRTLGAGLITVIVEQGVAQTLSQAGRQRAAAWSHGDFRVRLGTAYAAILDSEQG